MTRIIEVNEKGELVLPREMLGATMPHTRFEVETEGNTLKLVPLKAELKRTEEEAARWVQAFLDWAGQPRPVVPILPDEAMRRESIYD